MPEANVEEFDLFVIGGGSGGVRAARMAKSAGAGRVGIVEEYRWGGTCVIRGCVPKKLLVYAAHFRDDFEDAAGYGWEVGTPQFSWPKLIANKDKEIDRLEGIYGNLLRNAGVEIFSGRAVFTSPTEISLNGQKIRAKHFLIATGGRPEKIDIPGAELALTSNEVFHLTELPKRILVYGAGYIAVEFAGIFHGLGSTVHLAFRREMVLAGFDHELREHLQREMMAKGIDVQPHKQLAKLAKVQDGIEASFSDGSTFVVDAVLMATGRVPNTHDLGLDLAGVVLDGKGAVKVDAFSQTSQPHIYAVGDVTNRVNLTPVAIAEAMCLVDTLYRGNPRAMDYQQIATAVFSQPPIGTVGLSEAEAIAQYGSVDLYKSSFRPMRHTLSGRTEKTFMKLIVDQVSQRIVGVHMLGTDAPEIVQSLAIAVKMGATKAQFDQTTAVHPTAAEEFVTMREKWKG